MPDSGLRRWRLASQIVFFAIFCGGILFAGSRYWPFPEDFFFRIDPFVAIIAMSASGVLTSGLLLSAVILILTFFFGRFFCGWVCPLGALIDFFEWTTRGYPRRERNRKRLDRLSLMKYGILVLIVAASGFSFQFVFLFDPMVVMTRFMGTMLLPVRNELFQMSPLVVEHTVLFLLFTSCILLLSLVAKRFWCRMVCPLGALLGLIAGVSPSGFVQKDCNDCPSCQRKCRTGAIDESNVRITRSQECIRCFDCLDACPKQTRVFRLGAQKGEWSLSVRLSRRSFLAWCGGGILGSAVFTGNAAAMPGNKNLLRPPHSPDEEAFLDLCIRCQACVNTCPTNALQPMLLQSGLYGLWTPMLAPSIGGCRPECNRCSTVCPTRAIGPFDLSTKYHLKIGTAVLSRDRCLPYTDGVQCGKCISGCPTAAIGFVEYDGVRFPAQIDFMLCVGCGICQNICNRETMTSPAIVVSGYGRNMPSGVPEDAIAIYLGKTGGGK